MPSHSCPWKAEPDPTSSSVIGAYEAHRASVVVKSLFGPENPPKKSIAYCFTE